MKFCVRFIIVSLILACLYSCRTRELTVDNIQEIEKRTDQIIAELLKSNDKVFFKRSTHATYAIVWVHNSNAITWYRVSKSIKKKTIANKLGYIISNEKFEPDAIYPYTFDADIIGYAYLSEKGDINTTTVVCSVDEFMSTIFPTQYKLAIQFKNDYSQIIGSFGKNITVKNIGSSSIKPR